MNQIELDFLRELGIRFGVYKVASAFSELVSESIRSDYGDNLEAVIHSDGRVLQQAVERMKENHPLRRFE